MITADACHLRHLIYELLGANGCRIYAERTGVSRNTVIRALKDRNASLARTLDLVFSLYLEARNLGGDPSQLLATRREPPASLLPPMVGYLGENAVSMLADRTSRTQRAITDGLMRPSALLWQHFDVMMAPLAFISAEGGSLITAFGRRIEPQPPQLLPAVPPVAQLVGPLAAMGQGGYAPCMV